MKRIINGKTYNTDTATHICDTSNGLPNGDFQAENSDLYVTKNRAYFVAGSGGASTRFSRKTGQNEWGGGAGIIPLGRYEALAECERHGIPEEIEEFFADMIETA
jgi:hypothetical protein